MLKNIESLPRSSLLIPALCALAIGCGDDDDNNSADSGTDSGADTDIDTDTDTDTDTNDDAGVDAGADLWESCPLYYDNPWGKLAECASFPVPLRWDELDGPKIDIFVQRMRGSAAETRGQIWLLEGGPGGSGADYDSFIDGFAAKYPDWDFYTIDHRGVGRSARLGCPEGGEAEGSASGVWLELGELPGCLAAVEAEWGEDLAEFTTTAAAHDLGYIIEQTREEGKDVFVYGCSYGTTWAHRYAQLFPDQATGVILDSLAIHIFFTDYDMYFNQVGEDFMEYCAADATCSSKLGADPWATTGALFDKIDTGHCPDLGIDRTTLRQVLGNLLMSWWLRPFIPAFVYRLDRCEAADVTAILNLFNALFNSEPTYYDTLYSTMLGFNIGLSDFWPDSAPTLEELQAIVDAAYISIDVGPTMGSMHDEWPLYEHDEYWAEWADTQLPVLMMNGDLDPQTPIWVATPAIDGLPGSNHYFVQAPRTPHGVVFQSFTSDFDDTYSTCGFDVMMDFLDDPTTEPDTSCLADILPIDFNGRADYVGFVFGTSDMWENGKNTAEVEPVKPPGFDEVIRALRRRTPILK
jgi:pimeloyl-ACP methyl ester carboxylesterase